MKVSGLFLIFAVVSLQVLCARGLLDADFPSLGGISGGGDDGNDDECAVPDVLIPSTLWDEYYECVLEYELEHMDKIMTNESEIASQMQDGTGPAYVAGHFQGNSKEGKEMGIAALIAVACLDNIKTKYGFSKCQMENVIKLLKGQPKSRENWKVECDPEYVKKYFNILTCVFRHSFEYINDCESKFDFAYRRINGTCNNQFHPGRGSAMRPFVRNVDANYADGYNLPRVAKSGNKLPSARLVSLRVHTHPKDINTDSFLSALSFTFGQFVDHDITKTSLSKLAIVDNDGIKELRDVHCGDDGCSQEGLENSECFPIPIPLNDPDFAPPCMMFVRSQPVLPSDCCPGPREQVNQLTAYLDLSAVYGSKDEENKKLRSNDTSRGRLVVEANPTAPQELPLLPEGESPDCRELTGDVHCFMAGDERVNEQLGLISMHTLFHRAHNFIEQKLYELNVEQQTDENKKWSGETLYHQTRKLLIAAFQQIIYDEFLPVLLGKTLMTKYRLNLEDDGAEFGGYNSNANADITNEFATAAYRVGHTMVSDTMKLSNHDFTDSEEMNFAEQLFRPASIFQPAGMTDMTGPDCIMLGLSSHSAKSVDRFLTRELQRNLFSENPQDDEPGLDLSALNIQRGRDHGQAGYLKFREFCGLSVATTFNELEHIPADMQEEFEDLYEHVGDIDLFPAGLAEEPVPGGLLGPTFACIIGLEFQKLRTADRFWFENGVIAAGFSQNQRRAIGNFSLARLMCDNLDGVETIQPQAMLLPLSEAINRGLNHTLYFQLLDLVGGGKNERVPCSDIPAPDLRYWQEGSRDTFDALFYHVDPLIYE